MGAHVWGSAVLAQLPGQDWGGNRGTAVPSWCSRPLPSLSLSSSCPSERSSQRKPGPGLGCKAAALAHGLHSPPGVQRHPAKLSFPPRMLFLSTPIPRVQAPAAALPPLIAFCRQSCQSRNKKTEGKGLFLAPEETEGTFFGKS